MSWSFHAVVSLLQQFISLQCCVCACISGMSARGSRAWGLDISPVSLLLTITISTFRSTLWHSDKLCCFSTFYWYLLSQFCENCWVFFFLEVNICFFAVLVCGYQAAQEQCVLSDNGQFLNLFSLSLFWHFCQVGNNAPFFCFWFLFLFFWGGLVLFSCFVFFEWWRCLTSIHVPK